jgi:hypothetical protein
MVVDMEYAYLWDTLPWGVSVDRDFNSIMGSWGAGVHPVWLTGVDMIAAVRNGWMDGWTLFWVLVSVV